MTKRTKRPKKDKKGQNGQKRPKKDKNAKRGQKDKRGQRGQKRTKRTKRLLRNVLREKNGIMWEKQGGGVRHEPTSWCLLTKLFLACQNYSDLLKHVLQKGGSDM